jgi:hypothetical protein
VAQTVAQAMSAPIAAGRELALNRGRPAHEGRGRRRAARGRRRPLGTITQRDIARSPGGRRAGGGSGLNRHALLPIS